MEAYPDDFCLENVEKELKSLQIKHEMYQEKLKADFRMSLYESYTNSVKHVIDNIPNYLVFSFPQTLTNKSRIVLLSELKERFPKICYNQNGYATSMKRVDDPTTEYDRSEYQINLKS